MPNQLDPFLEAIRRAQAEQEDAPTFTHAAVRAGRGRPPESERRVEHLPVRLELTRRLWPDVHRAAVELGVPLFTQRLPREQTTPIVIATSESGAVRLGAAVPELKAGQGPT